MADPKFSAAPLHVQLSRTLQDEIQSAKFKQGDLFATEKSLMERFGVSSTTVRRALQDLVQKGYLFRKVGKGTFVRRPYIEEPLGLLSSFYEEMEAQGIKPGSKVIDLKVVEADAFVAGKLQIAEAEKVFLIHKIMFAADEPMAVFESYWLLEIGQALAKYDLVSLGVFSVVENELGFRLGEAEGTIEAAVPSKAEARLLKMSRETPLLIKRQFIYTMDGRPVNVVRLAYRGDRYKFRVRMVRNPGKSLSKGNITVSS